MALHEDRARAGSFGADAEAYDRARPTYPTVLLDHLLAEGSGDVLDVGCGTGKAGRLFAERGCRVLGIEPDERMADVARSHGLEVEVSTFESWDDQGRRFDLLTSAQAWHWVDPVLGAGRAAQVLRPGGRLALFWNIGRHDDAMQAALDEVYAEHFPENEGPGVVAANAEQLRRFAVGNDGSGDFDARDLWTHPWAQTHTWDEWLDQLATHSNHRMLPDDRRVRLLDAVGEVIDRLGGTLTLQYDTILITAVRRAGP